MCLDLHSLSFGPFSYCFMFLGGINVPGCNYEIMSDGAENERVVEVMGDGFKCGYGYLLFQLFSYYLAFLWRCLPRSVYFLI